MATTRAPRANRAIAPGPSARPDDGRQAVAGVMASYHRCRRVLHPDVPGSVPPLSDPSGAIDVVHLDVPADVRYLRLLRVSAAAASAEMVLDLQRLDDLRLAIDELAAAVIATARPGSRLRVSIRAAPRTVVLQGRTSVDGALPALSDVGEMLVATVCRSHGIRREGDEVVFDLEMDTGAV